MEAQGKNFIFDVAQEFVVRVPHPDFADKKACRLRFPSDEEWAARSRRNVQVRKNLGRDKFRTDAPNAAAEDLALFEKIRIDKDGPTFDEAEASVCIAKLETAEVTECERNGNRFTVTLKAPGGITKHEVKMPTLKQISEFGNGSVTPTGRRDGAEYRIALEPAARLYDQLEPKPEAYAGAVPIVHKDAVIREIVLQTRKSIEDDDDPEA